MKLLHLSFWRSSGRDEHDNDYSGRLLILRIGRLMLSIDVEWRR